MYSNFYVNYDDEKAYYRIEKPYADRKNLFSFYNDKIGHALISFIEIDPIELIDAFKNYRLERDILENLKQIHAYFNIFDNSLFENLEKKDLNEIDEVKEFYESFLNTLEICINKYQDIFKTCFSSITDSKFKDLNTIQRFALYQSGNDSFGKGIKISYMSRCTSVHGPREINIKNNDIDYYKSLDFQLFESYSPSTLDELCEIEFIKILEKNIIVKSCNNCGKFFIPSVRSDEIYCDRLFSGNRTCKQVGYENKDRFIKAYRTAYKTKNAAKIRNLKNNSHAEDDFKKWVYRAKEYLSAAQDGKISYENFLELLKK